MGDNNDNNNQKLQLVMQQAMQAALQAVLGQDPAQNPVVQALVQNQVQQAIAQLNLGGQAQQPAPQQVQLGAAPAGDAPWSLSESTGLKVYMAVIAPFSPLYDGEERLLNSFLRMIFVRFENYGIESVLFINDSDNKSRDLTREYGALTQQNVTDAALADLRTTNRKRQAQEFLYKLVQGSITPRLLDRLIHKKDECTIDIAVPPPQGQHVADNKTSGTAQLYQLIVMLAVQTKATVSSLLNRLDNLSDIMQETKSDIEKFNSTIDGICDELRARKANPPDLLTKLFAGYQTCDDTVFVECIARKEEMYYDNSIKDLTSETLMQLALEKHKIMCYDKKCWLKKTPKELEFIAMQTELAELRGATAAPSVKASKKKKKDDAWAWKKIPPKEGEPHEIVKNGKTHVHCPHHKQTEWVLKVNDGKVHFENCEAHLEEQKKKKNGTGNGGARQQALTNVMENPDAAGDESENI